MALERGEFRLERGTGKRLKEICKQFDPGHSVSASDLVRFALHEVYGIEFSSVHTWEDIIRKEVKHIKEKEKFKERG